MKTHFNRFNESYRISGKDDDDLHYPSNDQLYL
jgi:hypothetical protein